MSVPQHSDSPPTSRGRDVSPKPLVSSSRSLSGSQSPATPALSDDGPKETRLEGTSSYSSSPVPMQGGRIESASRPSVQESSDRTTQLVDEVASMSLESPGDNTPNPTAEGPGFSVKVVDRTTWVPKNVPPGVANSVNPPRSLPVASNPPAAVEASDALQVNAAEYPWLYMSNTLDACFQNSEPSASKQEGTSTEQELPASAQNETTRVQFDDAKSDEFSKAAPGVMQAFHAHGETCSRVEAEALKLAMSGSKPTNEGDEEALLQKYRDMLQTLETLHAEAVTLEASIVELTNANDTADEGVAAGGLDETTEPTARSQILGIITSSVSVIRARIMNLSMAQELVDSALENLTIGLRMESLGIE